MSSNSTPGYQVLHQKQPVAQGLCATINTTSRQMYITSVGIESEVENEYFLPSNYSSIDIFIEMNGDSP